MKTMVFFSLSLLLVPHSIGSNAVSSACKEPYSNLNEMIFAAARAKEVSAQRLESSKELAEIENRFTRCCREMIERDADINHLDSAGASAAMLATYFHLDDIFLILKEAGADLDLHGKASPSANQILNGPQ